MMKCSQYQEKFWDYYDGTLTAEEAAELEKHLESCPECAAEAKMVKQMLESLHTLPEAALPEGYHEELMGKIAKENLAKVSDASIDRTEKQEEFRSGCRSSGAGGSGRRNPGHSAAAGTAGSHHSGGKKYTGGIRLWNRRNNHSRQQYG